jgi:hypothetical protein
MCVEVGKNAGAGRGRAQGAPTFCDDCPACRGRDCLGPAPTPNARTPLPSRTPSAPHNAAICLANPPRPPPAPLGRARARARGPPSQRSAAAPACSAGRSRPAAPRRAAARRAAAAGARRVSAAAAAMAASKGCIQRLNKEYKALLRVGAGGRVGRRGPVRAGRLGRRAALRGVPAAALRCAPPLRVAPPQQQQQPQGAPPPETPPPPLPAPRSPCRT